MHIDKISSNGIFIEHKKFRNWHEISFLLVSMKSSRKLYDCLRLENHSYVIRIGETTKKKLINSNALLLEPTQNLKVETLDGALSTCECRGRQYTNQ